MFHFRYTSTWITSRNHEVSFVTMSSVFLLQRRNLYLDHVQDKWAD